MTKTPASSPTVSASIDVLVSQTAMFWKPSAIGHKPFRYTGRQVETKAAQRRQNTQNKLSELILAHYFHRISLRTVMLARGNRFLLILSLTACDTLLCSQSHQNQPIRL
ncbi:MAG: hypothetical protein AAF724_05390 [Pseudomonadota bacterium]